MTLAIGPMTRRQLSREIRKLSTQLILAGQFVASAGYYVSSTVGSDTTGDGSFEKPYATLSKAVSIITNPLNGSIVNDYAIYLMPGHTESVTAAAWVTVAAGNTRIIGLGIGSNRPTLTWTTSTAAQLIISGNNVSIENCVLDFTGIDAVVAAISVTGTHFRLERCLVTTNSGTTGCVLGILTAATASNMVIRNNRFVGPATNSGTTTTAQIQHEVGVDYVIEDNYFTGKMTQAILNATTLLRGQIHNNRFVIATGTKAIAVAAASTPFITNNRINVPSGTAPIVAAAGFVAGNIYSAAAGVTAGTASTI